MGDGDARVGGHREGAGKARHGLDFEARVAARARRRTVSIAIALLILGGLGYIAWTSLQQKQAASALVMFAWVET